MLSIMVLNAKGGCGKTTLATTLAAAYASRGYRTTLLDHDSQGSSEAWHRLRPPILPAIHLVPAYRQSGGATRTWQLAPPPGTQRIVTDAPAGVHGLELEDLVKRATAIVVPVLPSPIDIHAAADFVSDLRQLSRVREGRTRIGVIANRVRENTLVYRSLEEFLNGLGVPFLTRLRDTQNYVKVAGLGMGVHEMAGSAFDREREQWRPVLEWLRSIEQESRLGAVSAVPHRAPGIA
ncbi:MAG: AAA family ATPase [Gammaproteobacteria bacterium]|nr:AAA family ATPase [Gammaproteobacteria bacterium]